MRTIALLALLPLFGAAPAPAGVDVHHVQRAPVIPVTVIAGKRFVRRTTKQCVPKTTSTSAPSSASSSPSVSSSVTSERPSSSAQQSSSEHPSSSERPSNVSPSTMSTTKEVPSSSSVVHPTSTSPSSQIPTATSEHQSSSVPSSEARSSSTAIKPSTTETPPKSSASTTKSTTKSTTSTTSTTFTTSTTSTTSTTKSTTKPTPTSATPTPKPTGAVTVDRGGVGPFSGEGTWFDVGLSACGTYDTNTMPIVAVGEELFDNWPGYNGLNPNHNPICGKHIQITYAGKSVIVEVTDRCPGCSERSLDLSPSAFEQLAPLGIGRLADGYTRNLEWNWVSGNGRLPELPLNGSLAWPGN